jgi:hypothetical protein
MIDNQQARWLKPSESLETTVLFAAQEGLQSIGGVDADGKVSAGDQPESSMTRNNFAPAIR